MGGPPQPAYLNGVIELEWSDSADDLLALCHEIEAEGGRERRVRWGPRTLDLDIIALGPLRLRRAGLEIPHPRALERAFVVRPLLDLAPRGIPFSTMRLLDAARRTAGQGCRLAGPWP